MAGVCGGLGVREGNTEGIELSAQQVSGDSSERSASDWSNPLLSILAKETVLFAVFTAVFYAITYKFQVGYLRYFNLSSTFAYVDTPAMITVGLIVSSIALTVWNYLGLTPALGWRTFFFLFIYFLIPILFLAVAAAIYIIGGVGWWFISSSSICIIGFGLLLIRLGARARRDGGLVNTREIFSASWAGASNWSVQDRVIQTVGPIGVISLIVIVGFVPIASDAMGYRVASAQRNFQALYLDGRDYVVVGTFNGTLMLAAITPKRLAKSYLTGVTRLVYVNDLKDVDLDLNYFPNGLANIGADRKWKSLKEFWVESFGSEPHDDRH